MTKAKIATASLAGCFGCHMALLDLDEALLDLAGLVEFDRSPVVDFKEFSGPVDIGLIEGGCANSENVRVLQDFRANCRILVSLGECAIMGGLPALRNGIPLEECLREAYIDSPTVEQGSGMIPSDKELPMILDRVYPCHEVVSMDYYLPGCPPRAGLIKEALLALVEGREMDIPYEVLKYD